MQDIGVGMLITLVGFVASATSIMAYVLGRRQEHRTMGKHEGSVDTQLTNISENLEEVKTSMATLNKKIERSDEIAAARHEKTIMGITALQTHYGHLEQRITKLEEESRR